MRPIELIVEGFTSFRSRQVLDFSTLDLFAITGATGAGKTSLLDAITFALYDRVAQKPNSSRELVSQGATQLKVEFRFIMRQTEYRVVRTWRNRGKTDEKKFLLDRLTDQEWERCDRTQKVEDIIGMDFETFTRVIILPQGQFDEFLKGEASKRREILRQLAGFQIFEQMRKESSDRTSRFRSEREGLENVLEAMQVPTSQEVTSQQTELENLEVSIPQLDLKVKQSRKRLDEEERLFTQIQQCKNLSVKLVSLKQEAPKIKVLDTCFRKAQLANSIVGTWTLIQTTRNKAKTAIAELAKANQNLETAKLDLEKQKQIFEQFRIAHHESQIQIEAQERNLVLAESLYIQKQQCEAELERSKTNALERSQVLAKVIKTTQQAELNLQTVTQQLQKLETAIAISHSDPERLKNLRQVAEPLTQLRIIQDDLVKQQFKVTQLRKDIDNLTQQLDESKQAIAKSESEFQTADKSLKEAEFSNLQALKCSHANALRLELHDGDKCPVCNNLYSVKGLAELSEIELIDTTALSKQKNVIERQLARLWQDKIKIETNLESSEQQLKGQIQEVIDLETQVNQLQKQIDKTLQTKWQAEDIIRERMELESQELESQNLIAERKEIAIACLNAENKLNTTQESLQLAQIESQKAEQECSHRQSQLQDISQRLQKITVGKSYEVLCQEISQAKLELGDRLQSVDSAYQKARETFVKYEETATKVQENHDLTLFEQSQQEINWQIELEALDFTESEFLSAQASRSQMESWQQEIDNYQRQDQELTTRLQVITEAIADQHTDEQAIAELRGDLQQTEQNLQQANEHRASIKAWLEQAQQKRQESQELEVRKNALLKQEQTYYTLAQDLKSDKFQEYILDSLQQELANRASVLLQQLSDNRYILQIESGDYWVLDNWNGGEKRRVRTLSGGETFAASLSMALALSERLSMGIELGSLFLDEGFGTLDSETLECVTQILESLRQQDRLIGVITHIQSLADRLPTQIHVRKSINGSELIKI